MNNTNIEKDKDILSLHNNCKVIDFVKILNENKMGSYKKEYLDLISHVDSMEAQLDKVTNEFKNFKAQLKHYTGKDEIYYLVSVKDTEDIQSNVDQNKEKLNKVKESIVKGTEEAIDNFKKKGKSALKKTINFLGIKDGLNNFKESLNQSIESTEKSISKIENISNEYHAIGYHVKSYGKAIIGKEDTHDIKENGSLSKVIQFPFKATKNTFHSLSETVDKAISKIESLENMDREEAIINDKEIVEDSKSLDDKELSEESESLGDNSSVEKEEAATTEKLHKLDEELKNEEESLSNPNDLKGSYINSEKEKNKLRGGENNLQVLVNNFGYNSLNEVEVDKKYLQNIYYQCKDLNIPVACIKSEKNIYKLVHNVQDSNKLKNIFDNINGIDTKVNCENQKEQKKKGSIEKNIEKAKERSLKESANKDTKVRNVENER